jgi:protein-tyrosine phosphatase
VIDTHCHLLPGVDDGARVVGDAVAMARQFVASGVTAVVCTPHLSTQFRASTAEVSRALERLRLALGDLSVDLQLHLGTEFTTTRVRSATPAELAERAIGGRYVLFELIPRDGRAEALAALEAVQAAGLEPIVAHPERSVEVQRDPALVEELRTGGALVQVVGPSLLGRVSDAVRTSAWALIERGLVDLVGSDAHRPHSPSIRLDLLADLIAQRSDRKTAERLLAETPARLLAAG